MGDFCWRNDNDLCSKLIRDKQEIASAEFDNATQRWVVSITPGLKTVPSVV